MVEQMNAEERVSNRLRLKSLMADLPYLTASEKLKVINFVKAERKSERAKALREAVDRLEKEMADRSDNDEIALYYPEAIGLIEELMEDGHE